MRKITTIERRPRILGEIPILVVAIRNKCYSCKEDCALPVEAIRNCDNLGCWLWPVRMGKGRFSLKNVIRNVVAEEIERRGDG